MGGAVCSFQCHGIPPANPDPDQLLGVPMRRSRRHGRHQETLCVIQSRPSTAQHQVTCYYPARAFIYMIRSIAFYSYSKIGCDDRPHGYYISSPCLQVAACTAGTTEVSFSANQPIVELPQRLTSALHRQAEFFISTLTACRPPR